MEKWYFPITMLPGIALLVLSTSTLLTALSNEIDQRIKEERDPTITQRKLKQLYLLNNALGLLYIGIGFMLVAGLFFGLNTFFSIAASIGSITFLLGVLSVLSAIVCLIIYSQRAVRLRQDQFQNN